MGHISHGNYKGCAKIANFFSQYTSNNLKGVFSSNGEALGVKYATKGKSFNIWVEYANPEDLFYVEISIIISHEEAKACNHYRENQQYQYYNVCWTEECADDLKKCLKFLKWLGDDITTERAKGKLETVTPYTDPVITLTGTQSEVKEDIRKYEVQNKWVRVLHQMTILEFDKCVAIIQYKPWATNYEAEQAHEEYLLSDAYEDDCKREQWDWIKNETD